MLLLTCFDSKNKADAALTLENSPVQINLSGMIVNVPYHSNISLAGRTIRQSNDIPLADEISFRIPANLFWRINEKITSKDTPIFTFRIRHAKVASTPPPASEPFFKEKEERQGLKKMIYKSSTGITKISYEPVTPIDAGEKNKFIIICDRLPAKAPACETEYLFDDGLYLKAYFLESDFVLDNWRQLNRQNIELADLIRGKR